MRPVVLCILDGWGLSPTREGNAVALGDDAELRPDLGELPARDARRARAGRRAARGADGQLRGRAHEHRRRAGWSGWTCRGSTTPSPTAASPTNAALRGVHRGAEGERRHGAPRRARLARRRARAPAADRRGGARRSPAAGVPVAVHAFLDGRDVPPKSALGQIAELEEALPDGRAHRARSSGASTPWTATSAGSGSARRWRRSCTPRASTPRRAAEAIEAAYERGETDEFVAADGDRRLPRARPTATGSSSPTSAPTGRGRSSRRWSTRSSTASRWSGGRSGRRCSAWCSIPRRWTR